MELFDWFKGFEKGIARLPKNQRAALFSECSKQCVKSGTLEIYKELYKRADGDLDKFFLKADELPGVKCEIVAKGSVYHLYFTECTCKLHMEGYISSPQLCECSRQSIIYILHLLWKDRTFRVMICDSILRGNRHCKMRIEAENQTTK